MSDEPENPNDFPPCEYGVRDSGSYPFTFPHIEDCGIESVAKAQFGFNEENSLWLCAKHLRYVADDLSNPMLEERERGGE